MLLSMVGLFVYSLSGGGPLVLNHDRPGNSSRQVGNSIVQDGKCE